MSAPVLILLTNYFNEEKTISFIDEYLLKQTLKNLHIVITDNGSKNVLGLKKIAEEHPNVFLFTPSKNLGYLGGANFGLDMYLKEHPGFPAAVIVSNSDLEFAENDCLEKLYSKYLASGSNTGIIGPAIYSPETGVNQNPFSENRIKKSKLERLKLVFSNYMLYSAYEYVSFLKRKFISSKGKNPLPTVEKVYAVHGAFIILTRTFFDKGGTISYPSFLFAEEIYLGEQALRLNLDVLYDGSYKIIHHEHTTTGLVRSKVLVKYMYDSVKYLLEKYY